MFKPVFVVSLGKILSGVSAPTLLPLPCSLYGNPSLTQQVIEFQGFKQIGVPDQSPIAGAYIGKTLLDGADSCYTLVEYLASAEYSTVVLHGSLHLKADACSTATAIGMAQTIKPAQCWLNVGTVNLRTYRAFRQ